jgi:hypothetical protein
VKAVEQWEEERKAKKKPRRRRRIVVPPKQVEEMSEDAEEDDEVVSVRGLFTRPVSERKDDERKGNDSEEKADSSSASTAVAATVSAVPPPPTENDLQAFIRMYVRDHGIHARFRWRDYHLQQLEAAAGDWKPVPLRDTPDQLKKTIMQWVRNQTEEEEEKEAAGDTEEVKEEC